MLDVNTYSSTNVTTGAYVQLDASTKISSGSVVIVDTSTQLMKLAVGSSGNEVDLCAFQGNGYPVIVPAFIPQGSRLSLRAISATANSGFCAVSLV